MDLPVEGSIHRGKVSRVEQYGAFVDLEGYRSRGLVHISQIVNYKLEKVEDAVSVNDTIWVKILEITREERDGRVRAKIRLSMKDAAQDGSGNDLGQERASSEAMKAQISQKLNSSIGMGVALDPMAPSKNGNLVLKSDAARASTVINGYALVGDDEGEPSAPARPAAAPVIKSMGRGRGTTLPAWMTRTDDGLTKKDERGEKKVEKKLRKGKKRQDKEDRKRRKHEHRRERRHSRSRRSYSSESGENHHRKQRRRGSDGDESRRCDSESDNDEVRHRKRGGHKHGKRERGRKIRSESEDKQLPFESVEEAKRLIAKLEAEKERTRR